MFRDRTEAGRRLAEKIASIVTGRAVVAAIPRGGVTVALPVAECLGAPLTVVYSRKLTALIAPELAFGSTDEDGACALNARAVSMLGLSEGQIEAAKARVGAEIRRRMELYGAPPLASYLPDAAVVLVDDGLATGATMGTALAYARRHGAREVTVAVPCAAPEAAARFLRDADRFVSLIVDPDFSAVGVYYEDFSPVTDDDVVAMLAQAQFRVLRAASTAIGDGR